MMIVLTLIILSDVSIEKSGGFFPTKESTYSMTYGKIEDFKEIAVSHTMVIDHTPDRYCRTILGIVKHKLKLKF